MSLRQAQRPSSGKEGNLFLEEEAGDSENRDRAQRETIIPSPSTGEGQGEGETHMKPDTVLSDYIENHISSKRKLTVQLIHNNGDDDLVLIEGDQFSLECLGRVLIAQSKYKKDCSFFFGPHTAGNAYFKKDSTHGFYIHRLPCLEKSGLKLASHLEKKEARHHEN
jgi:hypothetical protein